MSSTDPTREHLIETYRRKARHYDFRSRFSPVPGYPEQAQRRRAVDALRLRPGATVVEIACGTGRNFALIERQIGPQGQIIGVDMTDAMLVQAQRRTDRHGWSNVSLVPSDAAEFEFPRGVDAILSTYAMTQVTGCAQVIAHGAAALSEGGRWVVLDVQVPLNAPRPLVRIGTAIARRFAAIDQWVVRRPWDAIRTAMADELEDVSWTELFFGTAFLAVGSRRRPAGTDAQPSAG